MPFMGGIRLLRLVVEKDCFAEVSKRLPQTPLPGGPRASGAPASKASLQLPAARPRNGIWNRTPFNEVRWSHVKMNQIAVRKFRSGFGDILPV
jgi:hypothetical protein